LVHVFNLLAFSVVQNSLLTCILGAFLAALRELVSILFSQPDPSFPRRQEPSDFRGNPLDPRLRGGDAPA
jgi:hypothetical protein